MTAASRGTPPSAWPLWLLAAPAFVAVWSGWVGLARLCGFGVVEPLPGIWDGLRLDTSITLPIGLEAYAAYALRVWLSAGTSARAVAFARRSTLLALALGSLGQVVYHLLVASGVTRAPWPVTAVVAVLPVAVFGMGAALAHLVQHDRPTPDVGHGLAVPGDRSAVTEPPDGHPATARRAAPANRSRPRPAIRRAIRPANGTDTGTNTASRVATLLAENRDLSAAALATRLGVSERTARRHRAACLATAQTAGDRTTDRPSHDRTDHEQTDADASTELEGSAA